MATRPLFLAWMLFLVSAIAAFGADFSSNEVTVCSLNARAEHYDKIEVRLRARLDGGGDIPLTVVDTACPSSSIDVLDFDLRANSRQRTRSTAAVQNFLTNRKPGQFLEIAIHGVFVYRHGQGPRRNNAIRPIAISAIRIVRGHALAPVFPGAALQ